MHLNDALARNEDLKGIVCHHEQACGIAAEAYGRVYERECNGFGVAMVTTGPGSSNIVTAVAGAWIDSIPLMVISGQVKKADLKGERRIRQLGVQELDILEMVKGITKFAKRIERHEEVDVVMNQAYNEMMGDRKGPVWVEVPLDVQGELIPEYSNLKECRVADISKSNSERAKYDELRKSLHKAERPLILAGHGIHLAGQSKEFKDTVARLGVPVACTWNAIDLMEYESSLYVGSPGVVGMRGPNFAVQSCDLLICIGARLDNVVTGYNPKRFGLRAKKYVIDIDSNEFFKDLTEDTVYIQADAKDALRVLRDMRAGSIEPWIDRVNSWKKKYSGETTNGGNGSGTITAASFTDTLSKLAEENDVIVTGSSGLSVEVFYSRFKPKLGQRIFLTSGLGSMGYGLPAAIGACIGRERKRVICVESDGSLMMNIQELGTLVGLQLDVKLFIMNNRGYGSIRNSQDSHFNGRYIGSNEESGLYIPCLTEVCRGFGLKVEKVERVEDLGISCQKFLEGDSNVLVVRTDEKERLAPRVSTIVSKDGKISSMPQEDMAPLLPIEVLRMEMDGRVEDISYKARGKE